MIMPNGVSEAAEDTGGVLRDAVAEFWETFYSSYTTGNHVKVPAIVHTMTSERWKAVGSVIALGYKQANYFPIELAVPFWESCINGLAFAFDSTELVNSFLQYVPDCERDVLELALKNFESVSTEDLMDTMECYAVRVVPTEDNLHDVLSQIAHRELVQAPAFVAECWQEIVSSLKPAVDIRKLLVALLPTTKKVLALLKGPADNNMDGKEKATMDHLKKYIRSLSQVMLKTFVRYVTGEHSYTPTTFYLQNVQSKIRI